MESVSSEPCRARKCIFRFKNDLVWLVWFNRINDRPAGLLPGTPGQTRPHLAHRPATLLGSRQEQRIGAAPSASAAWGRRLSPLGAALEGPARGGGAAQHGGGGLGVHRATSRRFRARPTVRGRLGPAVPLGPSPRRPAATKGPSALLPAPVRQPERRQAVRASPGSRRSATWASAGGGSHRVRVRAEAGGRGPAGHRQLEGRAVERCAGPGASPKGDVAARSTRSVPIAAVVLQPPRAPRSRGPPPSTTCTRRCGTSTTSIRYSPACPASSTSS